MELQAPARPPRPVRYRPVVCGLALATLEAHLLERRVPFSRTKSPSTRRILHPRSKHKQVKSSQVKSSLDVHVHVHKNGKTHNHRSRGDTPWKAQTSSLDSPMASRLHTNLKLGQDTRAGMVTCICSLQFLRDLPPSFDQLHPRQNTFIRTRQTTLKWRPCPSRSCARRRCSQRRR